MSQTIHNGPYMFPYSSPRFQTIPIPSAKEHCSTLYLPSTYFFKILLEEIPCEESTISIGSNEGHNSISILRLDEAGIESVF